MVNALKFYYFDTPIARSVDDYQINHYNLTAQMRNGGYLMATYALNVDPKNSFKDVVKGLEGAQVELILSSGRSYIGKLKMVGDFVVVVSELSGKEFYDAVIEGSDIVAVEVRVRDRL